MDGWPGGGTIFKKKEVNIIPRIQVPYIKNIKQFLLLKSNSDKMEVTSCYVIMSFIKEALCMSKDNYSVHIFPKYCMKCFPFKLRQWEISNENLIICFRDQVTLKYRK